MACSEVAAFLQSAGAHYISLEHWGDNLQLKHVLAKVDKSHFAVSSKSLLKF